jgi:hypothetical protein
LIPKSFNIILIPYDGSLEPIWLIKGGASMFMMDCTYPPKALGRELRIRSTKSKDLQGAKELIHRWTIMC